MENAFTSIRMTEIPGGTEELRDDRTHSSWTVEIRPFLLATVPVTQGLYTAVTEHKPVLQEDQQKPAVHVSWQAAVFFCNLLSQKEGLQECYTIQNDGEEVTCNWDADGYRLPTEAEWQYACKAGTSGYRYGEIGKIAWYDENSGGESHNVGTKEPNAWGLYDMHGNVWEWCSDWYAESYAAADKTDPTGPKKGMERVVRGGSWDSDPARCRSATRTGFPDGRYNLNGFRVVVTVGVD